MNTLPMVKVLERLKADAPEAFEATRVVGQWFLLEFAAKPSAEVRETLKGLDFHWNRTRAVWQCSWFPRSSPADSRCAYGSVKAADLLGRPTATGRSIVAPLALVEDEAVAV